MATDPIIELIAKQSMARLDEMEAELERTMRRTAFELEQVRDAKVLKSGTRGDGPLYELAAPDHAPRRRRGNGRGNKSAAIKRIMESEPNRIWRPGEISARLAEQGITLSRDGARVAMNRMGDELEKLPEGYRLGRGQLPPVSPAAAGTANGENREMRLLEGTREGPG